MQVAAKLSWLLLLASPVAGLAQRTSVADLVRLQPVQQIRNDLDAWPLIVDPKNDAERRINSTLDSYNAETRTTFRECDESPEADEWIRKISVTMAGPRYLSLRAAGSFLCGNVHSDPYDSALVFDIVTGELLDGSTIAQRNSEIRALRDIKIPRYPQSDKFLISSPTLDRILIAAANGDCKESLQDVERDPVLSPILYSVWPDAKKNQVVIKPVSLSYLDYLMCSEEVGIPLDQARGLGFDQAFLDAIEIAHRRFIAASRH